MTKHQDKPIEAVVGFMFDPTRQYVGIIHKLRPKFHAGLLNGIGGKLEPGETPLQSMIREFREETGVQHDEWGHYTTILDSHRWKVHYFRTFSDNLFKISTQTDEEVRVMDLNLLYRYPVTPNLRWLVPLALCPSVKFARVLLDEVTRRESGLIV